MDIINKFDKTLIIQIEENNYSILLIILNKLKYKSEITILVNIQNIMKTKMLETLLYIRQEYMNKYVDINIINIDEFNEYEKYDSIIFLKNSDIKYYDTKYKYHKTKIDNKLKFGIIYDEEIIMNNFLNISLIQQNNSKNLYIKPDFNINSFYANPSNDKEYEEEYLIFENSNKINYDMVHLISKLLKIKITIVTDINIHYKELDSNIKIITNSSIKELLEYLKKIRSVIIIPNKRGENYYEKNIPEILYICLGYKIPIIINHSIYEINKDLINNSNVYDMQSNIKQLNVYNTFQDILLIISELSKLNDINQDINTKQSEIINDNIIMKIDGYVKQLEESDKTIKEQGMIGKKSNVIMKL